MNMSNKTANTKTANTKTATTAKPNAIKTDSVLAMCDVIALAHSKNICFIASDNKSTQYRIFNGKSSLHIQKTQYKLYATDTDYELLETAKIDGVKCERGTNASDGVRPNTIFIAPNAIEKVFETMFENTKNRMQ